MDRDLDEIVTRPQRLYVCARHISEEFGSQILPRGGGGCYHITRVITVVCPFLPFFYWTKYPTLTSSSLSSKTRVQLHVQKKSKGDSWLDHHKASAKKSTASTTNIHIQEKKKTRSECCLGGAFNADERLKTTVQFCRRCQYITRVIAR